MMVYGGKGSLVWTGAAPETKEPTFHSESSRMGHYGVQGDVQAKLDGKKEDKDNYVCGDGWKRGENCKELLKC